ncbi:MAG: archease [Thiogranum sp.]|nr:archease [Thiogranum sp.]
MVTQPADRPVATPRWEHFPHGADVGVRGIGADVASAFEQTAIAMTAVITEPQRVLPQKPLTIVCEGPDAELLLYDWLNTLVYEMATRHMLFSQFHVEIDGERLRASAWGEKIDIPRHQPRVEIKGATFTELDVSQCADGTWRAQCILDV